MAESAPHPAIDLGRLAPALGSVCEEYLARYHDHLAGAVGRGEPGVTVAHRHARILDGLLGALYCASNAAARSGGRMPRGRVALVAVGGYGRGLVALRSDIDVLFLCEDPGDPHAEAIAEGLLYPLWDLGFDIGHAVRGVDETLRLARDDIRTATTLLDLRWVSGDASLVDELVKAGRRQVFEPALEPFLDALREDTTARHERFGGSLYLLEPEVKLGRGGLRDLDVAEWAARARWDGRGTEHLVRTGALLAREAEELESAREMLWRVRGLLHMRAGRKQDRLTFADQEEIATAMGFVDGVTLAVEQFMQAYYRHARTVALTSERMLERARPPRRRGPARIEDLGDGIKLFDEQVTFDDSARLEAEPVLALRLYAQVVKQGKPPYPFARDAVARVTGDETFRAGLRRSAEASRLFLSLLCHAGEAPLRGGSILGELHEVGLAVAMIPELGPLTGRVQHDMYNVYTVDVHCVAAVDRLRALMRGDLASSLPLPSRLAAETPRPLPLFAGVLLHEIGKTRGRDVARLGAELSRPIAERLGLSPVDVEHVAWLVQESMSLYHWATRRDTSDPDTIADVARHIGTVERLRDLFLLTVVDLSTTNPNAMTSWKARMLEDLYLAVVAQIEGDVRPPAGGRAEAIRKEVRVGFVGDAGQAELERFLAEMPDRYLLSNPVDVIRVHARAARDRDGALATVTLIPGPTEDLAEILVVTDDRPGLLADVAGVLSANRLEVVSAQIHTRAGAGLPPEAFDVFHVRRDKGVVSDDAVRRLERDLLDLLAGKVTVEALMARRPVPPTWAVRVRPDVRTEVTVDNDASPRFTVVDVYTRDRPGLLHLLARTLHAQGLSIALSRVNTEGDRVADVFYVEEAGGGKLGDQARLRELQAAVVEAVEAFHAREASS